ncbi:MAG: hypothetical protein NWE93_11545 [Candidatus Bathyarchaeota archaeon]|nr:hypothetical protein [Candidatus Bathyarchaeota archaeon]
MEKGTILGLVGMLVIAAVFASVALQQPPAENSATDEPIPTASPQNPPDGGIGSNDSAPTAKPTSTAHPTAKPTAAPTTYQTPQPTAAPTPTPAPTYDATINYQVASQGFSDNQSVVVIAANFTGGHGYTFHFDMFRLVVNGTQLDTAGWVNEGTVKLDTGAVYSGQLRFTVSGFGNYELKYEGDANINFIRV